MAAKRCIIPGCVGKSRKPNVYCASHHKNLKLYGDPLGPDKPEHNDTDGEMYCYGCDVYYDCTRFTFSKLHCDDCYHLRNIAAKYGLTLAQLKELYRANPTCQICDHTVVGKDRHIDHDHSCCSGRSSCGQCIRGILCFRCNAMLGFARDDKEILLKAIDYLSE